jgi:hypothetical protein
MSLGSKITLICVVLIVYYCLNQIFSFYGVSSNTYDVYYYFYAFLLFSIFILPNEYPSI